MVLIVAFVVVVAVIVIFFAFRVSLSDVNFCEMQIATHYYWKSEQLRFANQQTKRAAHGCKKFNDGILEAAEVHFASGRRTVVSGARVVSGAEKAFDRGGPIWPPGSNAADDRLGDADPHRHKLILNEWPRSSPCALSHTVLLLPQTTTT